MTDKKTKSDEPIGLAEVPNELSERGREIWLAGLGALARVEEEGTKIFKTLVERGEVFEQRGRKQIEASLQALREQQKQATESVSTATQTFTDAAESMERVVSNTLTDTLGRVGMPTRDEVEALSGKVSQLSEKLDALSAAIEARKQQRAATAYHVVPHEKGWAVKREGAERATSVHETKKEAVSAARDEAKNHVPSRLTVHKRDGTAQETFTYGEDE